MDRVEAVRGYVEGSLREALGQEEALKDIGHLKRVAEAAGILAGHRGLSRELAQMAGWLHDYYADKTHDREGHGPKGAVLAREVLKELQVTSQEEADQICQAIHVHSDKLAVHEPLDEVLKDADVVAHMIEQQIEEDDEGDVKRRDAVMEESRSWEDQELGDFLWREGGLAAEASGRHFLTKEEREELRAKLSKNHRNHKDKQRIQELVTGKDFVTLLPVDRQVQEERFPFGIYQEEGVLIAFTSLDASQSFLADYAVISFDSPIAATSIPFTALAEAAKTAKASVVFDPVPGNPALVFDGVHGCLGVVVLN